MVKRITLSPSSSGIELEQIVQTLKCINNHVIKLLAGVVAPPENSKSETACRKEWTDIVACRCPNSDSSLLKLRRLGHEVGRMIMYLDEEDVKNGKTL